MPLIPVSLSVFSVIILHLLLFSRLSLGALVIHLGHRFALAAAVFTSGPGPAPGGLGGRARGRGGVGPQGSFSLFE